MADTSIEWTDRVLNPTSGCDSVSPGCDNCYALGMAKRLKAMGQPGYQRDGDPRTSGPGFGLTLHPEKLDQVRRWKKPAMIFLNSMSDIFHEEVPDEYLARVWATMAETPQHTYQILTKRHGRMRSLLNRPSFRDNLVDGGATWPMRNVWLGVSVEDQKWADIRIPALLDTPAAVRWISAEPLLGPITLRQQEWIHEPDCLIHNDCVCWPNYDAHLDWVVVGGESGPGARPMRPEWARSLRDQCSESGVPFLFKQAGSVLAREWGAKGKGGDPAEWPESFPREYPNA